MAASTPAVSFEVFPARTPAAEASLDDALTQLSRLRPAYVSVTYGADGSGQERSVDLVRKLAGRRNIRLAAHLTCVGASRGEIDDVARGWWEQGVRRIVALRGDMPGGARWAPHDEGYSCAVELVEGLQRVADFNIAVAAYPEVHPDSPSVAADLENLKRKQDAGAAVAITQYCFENEPILRLRDRAVAAGVTIPIVPGILPVTNFAKVVEFSERCGASVPEWLAEQFDGLDDEPEARSMVAASVAAEQCRTLASEGFDRFHFYTLNRAAVTYAICRRLGIHPGVAEAA